MHKEKLIRDKIPEYVSGLGEKFQYDTRVATAEELDSLFKAKLLEEANEVATSENKEQLIQELADIMQVVLDYMDQQNITNEVIKARIDKRIERGGFQSGLVLINKENTND